MKTIEEQLDARERRRLKADERAWDALGRQIERADQLIGVLIRDGKEVNYVYPQGGRYREGTRQELISFLIRNRYV